MARNHSECSFDYNLGFIEGLLWVMNSGNAINFSDLADKVFEIRNAMDSKLCDIEKDASPIDR